MISKQMSEALNAQVNREFFSSYLYLSMAAYFEAESFPGFAKWMMVQSQEEYEHGMKFYEYLNQVNARVVLEAIEKPKTEWNSPLDVFEASKEHEIYITNEINKLAALAKEENDFATSNFLIWFVNEQVEEVANVSAIVDKFKLIGNEKSGLFMLDRELGARQTTPEE
jgi:ferritin